MAKRIKALFYGEPGVGKSVFASKAPRPFFITTDGNYEWLEDFGAKPEDHKQVFSWEEAKAAFAENYENYDTIVVDLLEDLFKWCEQEYCIKAKLDHVSDVGFGKGYDITRNEFFLEISKLLGKDKNIIFLSHGITFSTKDRRGVEHFKHAPSSRIPDKVIDMIEGRLRYCLRCYMKGEEQPDGTVEKKRYLSLVPKENEFGIIRGVDETKIPQDIPLDWNEFVKAIGYSAEPVVATKVEPVKIEPKVEVKVEEPKVEEPKVEEKTVEADDVADAQKAVAETVEPVQEKSDLEPIVLPEEETQEVVETVETVKVEEPKAEPAKQPLPTTKADQLAAIKAKLAAMKAGK